MKVESTSNSVKIYYILFMVVLTVCILAGGLLASIAAIMYGALLSVQIVAFVYSLFKIKSTSMAVGVDRASNSVVMSKYDAYTKAYEERLKKPTAWIQLAALIYILVLFISQGFWLVAWLFIVYTVLLEILKYAIYLSIVENKTRWGAAAYIVNLQNFLNELPKDKKEVGSDV
jgi:hypothetical protein